MKTIKYNPNITLIKEVQESEELAENQYYVLMVTDNPNHPEHRKFYNVSKGWLGLECGSGKEIYISHKFNNRHNPARGIVFVAQVANPSLCCELTY